MDVCIAGKKPKLKLSLKLALSLNLATRPQPKGNLGKRKKMGEIDHDQPCAAAENVYRCLNFGFYQMFKFFVEIFCVFIH